MAVPAMALLVSCSSSSKKTCEALRDLEIGTLADSVVAPALENVAEADRAALMEAAAAEREAVARYWVPACLAQTPESLRCIGREIESVAYIHEYINGGYGDRCGGVIARIWDSVKLAAGKR